MANLFVRSTDGSDADNGTTWALAKAKLSGASAIDAAGDTVYISDNHSETTAASQTINLAGTYASPVRVLCVDDTGDPSSPTTLATTAAIATTGASPITVNGVGYLYGLTLDSGSSTNSSNVAFAQNDGDYIFAEQCKFILNGSATTARIAAGSTSAGIESKVTFKNCDVQFDSTSQGVSPGHCKFVWEGGTLLNGGLALPSALIRPVADTMDAEISGLDLSLGSSTMDLVGPSSLAAGRIVFRNCKLPSGWSGVLATPGMANVRAEMWNCDSTDTNYRMWINDYFGDIKQETVIVRTGGASDGDTPISWKMTSSADAEYPMMVLHSPEIVVRNTTTGSSVTATIEIVHDSTTALTDAEVWVGAMYLGTSGVPIGTWLTDSKADVLASATNQTSSSVTWTTTGITNVNKQKLSVTFTPQEKGYIHLRVALAKASYTVYVCPKVDIT